VEGEPREALHDLLLRGGGLVVTQVRDEVACQDVEDRGLAYGVPAQEADDGFSPRDGETVEGELVGAVAVDVLGLQLVREVDYAEGVVGALAYADAAAAAEELRDVGLPVLAEAYRLPPGADHGAELDAD